MTVDLPHPDGPIKEVTWFFSISQNTFLTATELPYVIDTLSSETEDVDFIFFLLIILLLVFYNYTLFFEKAPIVPIHLERIFRLKSTTTNMNDAAHASWFCASYGSRAKL